MLKYWHEKSQLRISGKRVYVEHFIFQQCQPNDVLLQEAIMHNIEGSWTHHISSHFCWHSRRASLFCLFTKSGIKYPELPLDLLSHSYMEREKEAIM